MTKFDVKFAGVSEREKSRRVFEWFFEGEFEFWRVTKFAKIRNPTLCITTRTRFEFKFFDLFIWKLIKNRKSEYIVFINLMFVDLND